MENQLKPNIQLIPREKVIKDAQLSSKVSGMIAEAERRFQKTWESVGGNFYVIFDKDEDNPVGIIGWTGPTHWAEPSWWVRPGSRRKGYGKGAVEKLAEEMFSGGVQRIGDILIDTKTEGEEKASIKLARHLRKCFNKLRG